MAKSSRANFILVFVATGLVGAVSCQRDLPSGPQAGATGGKADGGSTAGSGGSSRTGESGGNSGGAGGASSGNGGTANGGNPGTTGGTGTGGNSGGTGGTAAGGSSGRSGGTASGGSSGGVGGTAAGGTSGGATGTGGQSGGAGGAGGTGSGTGGAQGDAGPDLARADAVVVNRPDTAANLAGNDATIAPDMSGATCPAGQLMCGTACTDVTASTTHCGGCTNVCASGQTCNAGACVEGGSAGSADGCTNDLASNLTLQQIAAYQSVKIPVMQAGTEVASASRNASVVQGRDTMFRVFVTLGSGWVTRELAARLSLTPAGGSAVQYYSRKSIKASSVDSDLTTSFQIYVPASAMAASLGYSVEVVECSAQSGTAGQSRFPSSGNLDLGVKNTGGLKVKVIPIQFGTLLPDTSAPTLAGYADYMRANPANDISLTVGDTITAPSPIDWSGTLNLVRSKRATDKPAADVYYYGLIKPAADLRTYCQSSCTTGIGFVVTSATGSTAGAGRAAMGVAFADAASAQTMAHEVGHNHGRNHAPCSTAGTISGVDASFPYSGGLIGSWGWDGRTQKLFDPTKTSDIMGYCNSKWISDYTYVGITTRLAAVNGVAMVYTPAESLSRWRILLIDERGPRWGIPITDEVPPEGDLEAATIYDATGAALTSVPVYRTAIGDIDASMLMVPEPQTGWYAVAVAGAPAVQF